MRTLSFGIGIVSCVCLSAAERKSAVSSDGSQSRVTAHGKAFAVVDLAEVYSEFYPAKAAQENFRLLAQQAESELEKMMNEGKPLFKERDELMMSEVGAKIRQKGEAIGQFQQEKEMKLNEQRQTILAEHFKEINLDMERMAKERNLACILNKTAILYTEPALDLTADAVREVNKPYQKEIREAEKKAAEAKARANETKEAGKK